MVLCLELLPMINFNLKPILTRKEKRAVIFSSFILISIVASLSLYGFFTTPKGKIFTWTNSKYFLDYNAYYAWINQYGQERKILAEILYTTEPHPALFFHLVFFLIGQISYFLKISPEIIFFIFSLLANFFLLFTLYYFISHFFNDFTSRFISFIFISLSSGLGWLFGRGSVDLWLAEISIFNILLWPLMMSLGLAPLLQSLLFFVKSFEEKGVKKAFLSGFFAFLLALIHPYDIVIFYSLALSYLIFFTKFWQHLKKVFIVFLFPLPIIIYDFLINYSHFVWYQHSLAKMPSPPLGYYFLGLFYFLIFSLFSLKSIFQERKIQILFLWCIVQFLLLYLPVNFQWKLSLGLSVFLGTLASFSLNKFYQSLNKKFPQILPGIFFITILIFFASFTNILIYKINLFTIQKKEYPSYLSEEIKEGFDWLKQNTSPQEAVLSSFEIGNFIPRYSGNKVFLGHWAQTIFVKEKERLVKKFFSGEINEEQIKNLFKTHKIKYIFYSDFEKKFGSLDLNKFGQEVFKNNSVSIFKINLGEF